MKEMLTTTSDAVTDLSDSVTRLCSTMKRAWKSQSKIETRQVKEKLTETSE